VAFEGSRYTNKKKEVSKEKAANCLRGKRNKGVLEKVGGVS